MKLRLYTLLASTSIFALSPAIIAHAADKAAPTQQVAEDSGATEEIIVTARRKEENLQDVPESVNAVTAGDIQKFNMTQMTDLTKLVPGLTVSVQSGYGGGGGINRGVTFGVGSSASTVQFYLNDAATDQTFQYMSMYDLGDIEALRGPQGVTRGKIAETGAITFTTKVPDLEKMGGYGEVTHGSLRDTNLQAAIGAPIVQDKLAVRIAAIYDDNADNYVNSINDQQKPDRNREGGRFSAHFVPIDDLDAEFTIQHMRQVENAYGASSTAGGGAIWYGPGNAAGGPPLNVDQRLTLEPGMNRDSANFTDLEGKVSYTFHGQKLTSVSGFQRYHFDACGDNNATDQVPGVENFNVCTNTFRRDFNQDLRLSSVDPLFNGYLDYTVGFFYDHLTTTVNTPITAAYLPGAFANGIVNTHDIITLPLVLPSDSNERAVYANATVHITKMDEITAGLRYGMSEQHYIPAAPPPVAPAGTPPDVGTYHPVIYNIEASHHFSDDLMVYLRTASTWRFGTRNPVLSLTTSGPFAGLFTQYINPAPPETSKDYEGGIKGSLFDKRVTFDFDYFHQTYSNYIGYVSPSVWNLHTVQGNLAAQYTAFTLPGVPAKIDGIEANATARITREWNATAAFSWDNAKINGNLPCNPPGITANSTAAQALAALGQTVVDLCPGTAPLALAPKWNLILTSEYDHAITDELQGFLRGLMNYNPHNTNTGNPAYIAPAYATLDLYLGVRSPDAQWEVSIYGKNITNNQTMLSTLPVPAPGTGPGTIASLGFSGANSAGYSTATLVPPREFGITARYSFGSR